MPYFYVAERIRRGLRRRLTTHVGSRDFVSYEEELVAHTMTSLGWAWEYESYEFVFRSGERFASIKPDFLVKTPEGVVFIEVKGSPERRGNGKKGRRHKRVRSFARRAGIDLAILYCPPQGRRARLRRRLKRALAKARKEGSKGRRLKRCAPGWSLVRIERCRRIGFTPILEATG